MLTEVKINDMLMYYANLRSQLDIVLFKVKGLKTHMKYLFFSSFISLIYELSPNVYQNTPQLLVFPLSHPNQVGKGKNF